MEVSKRNIFDSYFPLTTKSTQGHFVAQMATEIEKGSQIRLGKDFYLNSRNSRITDGLKNKDFITIGKDESCNIIVSDFYNSVENQHAKISKSGDKLIITDLSTTSNTEIIDAKNVKPFYCGTKDIKLGQENTGDCYLLATLCALSQSDFGANLIKEMVQIDKDGNYVITFINQEPIIITINELNGEGDKQSVSGDLGIKAIERAYAKLAKGQSIERNMEFLDKGGLMDTSLKIMTGYNSDVYSTDDKNFENIINNLAKNNNKNYVLTCGTKHSKYSNFCDSNKQFYAGHAYAIKNIDSKNKTIEIINPHNTKKTQIVSYDDFKKHFELIFAGQLSQ